MYFKPRIFISSVMKDKLTLRKNIKDFLLSVGAECLLYEGNLTPSTLNTTYRYDITEADFVIIILDEHYGSLTERGISGTEEEFNIAIANKMKTHIYLKNTNNDELSEKQQNFIDKIQNQSISYYYYKDDKELLKRIKESIFTIAKEIVINNISNEKLDDKTKLKMAFNHDYELAIGFISIHNQLLQVIRNNEIDYILTNIVTEFTDYPYLYLKANPNAFYDIKLYDLLLSCYQIADEFNSKHVIDFTSHHTIMNVNIPLLGEITITHCKTYDKCYDTEWYQQTFDKYKKSFDHLIEYIEKRKVNIDSYLLSMS